jgi:hypothetical protein
MSVPGFRAEATIYRSTIPYQVARAWGETAGSTCRSSAADAVAGRILHSTLRPLCLRRQFPDGLPHDLSDGPV